MGGNPDYDQLPVAHRTVLRLVDDGVPHAEIAERLDLEPEAVPVLIAVARAKLARLATRPLAPPRPRESRGPPG